MRSWAALGAYVDGLGAVLGPMLAILGRSWASIGGPGTRLGPLCAILGRSWSLCWRSWAALGAYVGDPGPLLGPLFAILAALGAYVGGPWRPWAEKWPKPEREDGKVAQTRAGAGSQKAAGLPKPPEAPRSIWRLYLFFL